MKEVQDYGKTELPNRHTTNKTQQDPKHNVLIYQDYTTNALSHPHSADISISNLFASNY